MSSKRHLRRRSCEGKTRHLNRKAAEKHAERRKRLDPLYNGRPYECPFCKGFHVGRPKFNKFIRFREIKENLFY